jgi:N-acetyl-1-D-myo-inositol-2-amino-2-deoxy-alpha-D-glucopyranoside deacetylase
VITPHPDDEVLIAGGTLAACAASGLPTAVVCLTRGEGGPIADPALATRTELPRVRLSELGAACAVLDVQWLKCYRREDGNLLWCDGQGALAAQLARIIRLRRPEAIITFGEDGLYYHPDHIATFRLVCRAAALCPDPPLLYRSVWPEDLMCELTAELAERDLPTDLWELEPEDFGAEAEDREGELVLDVRPFVAQKLRALRCHRTQIGPGHAFGALPADLAERFLGLERLVPVSPDHRRPPEWLARLQEAARV